MIDKTVELLDTIEGVSAWKIHEMNVEAQELFFVGKNLDMNRSKKVRRIQLTVYHDFEEAKSYRGSASVFLHPTYSQEEIKKVVKQNVLAASFVKNESYPLVKPARSQVDIPISGFTSRPLEDWLEPLSSALFQEDNLDEGGINSAELFLDRAEIRILNSEGVDVKYTTYKGSIEIITEWRGRKEDVELYKEISFSDFEPEKIAREVKRQLALCRERVSAKPTPAVKVPVLLTGESIQVLFQYYLAHSSLENVYNGISRFKVGDSIQGGEIAGDRINLRMEPYLPGSVYSAAWDADGFPLKAVSLVENGILENHWGSLRFAHYLNSTPTGNLANTVVQPGSRESSDFRQEPHLEILSFSDFQCNPLTGDFGGEIRLGYHSTGKNSDEKTPVTGGSITGNIMKVQRNLALSKEIQIVNNFKGPETIKLQAVNITGAR